MALPHFCGPDCPDPCPKKQGGGSGKGKESESKNKWGWLNKPNPKEPPKQEREGKSPSLAEKFSMKGAQHLRAEPTGKRGKHLHVQEEHGVHFNGPYERDITINAMLIRIMEASKGKAHGEAFQIVMDKKAPREEVLRKLEELLKKYDRSYKEIREKGQREEEARKKKEGDKPKFRVGQMVPYRGKDVEIKSYLGSGMYVVQHFGMFGRPAGLGRYHESDLG